MDCNACGKPLQGGISIGAAMLCHVCAVDVRTEIDRLRAAGKPVDALAIARRIFREQHCAGGYLLRDIPEGLWTAAKHRAVDQQISLRELLIAALREYLK